MIDKTVHVLTVPGVDPWRDNNVAQLKAQAFVCEHADPEKKGLLQNWMGALECANKSDQEWVAILSDDAIPLKGWKVELAKAVQHSPSPVLGLTYFGNVAHRYAKRPYLVGNGLLYGGAIAYRTEILGDLHLFAEKFGTAGNTEDDRCVMYYMGIRGDPCALVTHAVFGQPSLADAPSLLDHPYPIRKPTRTIETHPRPNWDEGWFRYDRLSDDDIRDMASRSLKEKVGEGS